MNFITKELDWLSRLIVNRINQYFKHTPDQNEQTANAPALTQGECPYSDFLLSHNMRYEERVYLITSFVPLLKPQLFDCFNVKNSDTGLRFAEFGCEERGATLIPTLETMLFILAGDDVELKIKLMNDFLSHPILTNPSYFQPTENITTASAPIIPSEELTDMLIFGKPFTPRFSSSFPARKITTDREWSELILDKQTMEMVEEIKLWVEYSDKIRNEWGLSSKIKPGFRALFYGVPGSGKTFTATLLGKVTGNEVYCIDLSMIVSKYIGETEKNLAKVFEIAENKNWILFFDEADALFGKRTGLKDAHDRYANQEVAYLLQRIEGYRGLVVLSTNLKTNIDEAFSRRFQCIIRFPMPNATERERLWRSTFSNKCELAPDVDLKLISEKYELAGGSILNVVQYASIMAMSKGENIIRDADIKEGIRREFMKDGKIMG
ncbi:MAG: ATP-binding protein [Paludibacteraceae bacterium]|nr:ATP-binding protein [Paludibacteraceae bacterium]